MREGRTNLSQITSRNEVGEIDLPFDGSDTEDNDSTAEKEIVAPPDSQTSSTKTTTVSTKRCAMKRSAVSSLADDMEYSVIKSLRDSIAD